ncbi:MAG: hypothetical protein IT429_24265 [Gemmataceae bacterium]|nr:hypothetical protein [Gemmataceae bacterium]
MRRTSCTCTTRARPGARSGCRPPTGPRGALTGCSASPTGRRRRRSPRGCCVSLTGAGRGSKAHEKGAFTDAHATRPGKFEAARLLGLHRPNLYRKMKLLEKELGPLF